MFDKEINPSTTAVAPVAHNSNIKECYLKYQVNTCGLLPSNNPHSIQQARLILRTLYRFGRLGIWTGIKTAWIS